jgi:hypothetical protein
MLSLGRDRNQAPPRPSHNARALPILVATRIRRARLALLYRPFNDPYIDAMSKHWNLSREQEVAAARLTRDAVEMLTAAAERGGIEIGERGPRFVQRLIDAHFLELEPGVHGRAVVRITEEGLAALLFKRHMPKPR